MSVMEENKQQIKRTNKPQREKKVRTTKDKLNPKRYKPTDITKSVTYECDKFISDIFDKIKASAYRKDKVEILQKYKQYKALKTILVAAYDKSLILDVDSNLVNLNNTKEKRHSGRHTYLYSEYSNLYKFYKGGDDNITQDKKIILLQSFMNRLHLDEAKFMLHVFEKTVYTEYRLTKKIVEEVFPEIQWGNRGPSVSESSSKQKPQEQPKPVQQSVKPLGKYLHI